MSILNRLMKKGKSRFFVHIPKTAGTSFRKALEQNSNVISDYSAADPQTSKVFHQTLYKNQDKYAFALRLKKMRNTVISGHMPLAKYSPFVGIENCVVFLREPSERYISHYKHIVRTEYPNLSIQEFLADANNTDLMSRLITLEGLYSIGCIGLTERYNDSLALISKLWGEVLPRLTENCAVNFRPLKSEEDLSLFSEQIATANKRDYALYHVACKLFENSMFFRQKGVLDRRAFAQLNARRGVIQGWGFLIGSQDVLEINLDINGKQVAVKKCFKFRPVLKGKGFPREGCVSFDFKHTLCPGDQVSIKDVETGRVLFEGCV
ncbi:sulfotransferase family 2 domain-containing protein [Motilimonas pumila]|uniref:Sulfotransferase family protein n=1 Tax=Motilimonas pumila TaxID=2303987 RepID=A0A418YE14_9GAMM|nr:sulfotransferase family 2 domain-containing protein [Motilimonas pumila]RJG42714.1 hypothetical protein D1Z90_11520 [Motilimonas pumila]